MLEEKSQFPLRILNSVQDKVRALAKKEGTSINKMGEKLLIEALRARKIRVKEGE